MNARSLRPIAFVLLSVSSLQLGIAISSTAFAVVGPLGATFIRSVVGAVLLTALIRPNIRAFSRSDVARVAPCAAALASMNVFGYLAIDRLPLGVVSAIEMLGPLTVAAWGQRGLIDLTLVALAGVGVLVLSLSEATGGSMEVTGLVFAAAAAVAFALYIVMGKRVTKIGEGLNGVALALVISALIQSVPGLAFGHLGALTVPVLATLVVAGVMATLIPFAAEMIALRSLSMATFGLLLSLEPVAAVISGVVIRGQYLEPTQIVGIASVIAASAGVLGPRGWMRRFGRANQDLAENELVGALTHVPLFSCMSVPDLASLSKIGEEREVPQGAILTTQGMPGDEFFVVANGAVGIRLNGNEIDRLGPGDFFGEIALLSGGLRTATAVADERTRVFVLHKVAFDALLKRQPRIEDKILTAISARMRYR